MLSFSSVNVGKGGFYFIQFLSTKEVSVLFIYHFQSATELTIMKVIKTPANCLLYYTFKFSPLPHYKLFGDKSQRK